MGPTEFNPRPTLESSSKKALRIDVRNLTAEMAKEIRIKKVVDPYFAQYFLLTIEIKKLNIWENLFGLDEERRIP